MVRLLFAYLLRFSAVSLLSSPAAFALDPEYVKQQAIYANLCSTLARPNVDCQCVARSHATYSHLSPNARYADYLVESYKQRLGLPDQRDAAFERYVDGRSMDEVQIEMFNAFDAHERHDPFIAEVDGCVVAKAPRVALAPLPSPPIFREVYEYRVSSTGWPRYEQCGLVETAKVLSADELAAWHYVFFRGIDGSRLSERLGLEEAKARELATAASQKMQGYEQDTRNIGAFCTSLLAAEDGSSGNIQDRFVRSQAQRDGPPPGLEAIDIAGARGVPSGSWSDSMKSVQAEVDQIKADNAARPSAEELKSELESTDEYKKTASFQNVQTASATGSLLVKGCNGAGRAEAFCSCFAGRFMDEIGEAGGSAALPVIQDGISTAETMALMATIDQSRFMRDVQAAQAISLECEKRQ